MLVSDYLPKEEVVRDANFLFTLFPASKQPGGICYALSPTVLDVINQNANVSAVITLPELAAYVDGVKGLIITRDPQRRYYELHNMLASMNAMNLVPKGYISPSAVIAPTAIVGQNVIIEDGVEVCDHVKIADNTIIGANTYLAPNVIIGTKGMQNLVLDGRYFNVKYVGGVKIGEGCEILANAIIQKPYQAFFTEIGMNTKISVKTSIGHGSKIGDNCMLAGNCTVAGNVVIGDNVWIGPSSTIADGLSIGSKARILIGSVVVTNINEGIEVSGNFALDHKKQLKNFAKLRRL